MYYQDELGLEDVPVPPDRLQDPVEANVPGMGLGRDPERTPMQWDASPNAGFSAAEPWLPLSPDWQTRNVAAMRDDPASILNLYRRLIKLRQSHRALALGDITIVSAEGSVLAYTRELEGKRFLVAVNLGSETGAVDMKDLTGTIAVGTDIAREGAAVGGTVRLAPNEGIVASVNS